MDHSADNLYHNFGVLGVKEANSVTKNTTTPVGCDNSPSGSSFKNTKEEFVRVAAPLRSCLDGLERKRKAVEGEVEGTRRKMEELRLQLRVLEESWEEGGRKLKDIEKEQEKVDSLYLALTKQIQLLPTDELINPQMANEMMNHIESVVSEVYKTMDLFWDRHATSIQLSNQNKTALSIGNEWDNVLALGSVPMSKGTFYWELRMDKSNDDMYGISQDVQQINSSCYFGQKTGFFIHHSRGIYGCVVDESDKPGACFNCCAAGTVVGFELSIGTQKELKVWKDGAWFSQFDVSSLALPLYPAVLLYSSGAQCTIIKFEQRN
eukprot:TRINITY_DN6587_c0_g1_i1.p1 TRINITY_DN6587_c0_g1~~TRINITY_DN6587_c0_g1_i1.p1  ORF type:complete len:321 (+),score=101.73 TRINITY_DN6587_c0_g1_i1:1-963(+)